MPHPTAEHEPFPAGWSHRHLLDLERLSPDEIRLLLDTAARFKEATDGCRKKLSVLTGRTIVNLFFENSTRTRTSFSLAARRLVLCASSLSRHERLLARSSTEAPPDAGSSCLQRIRAMRLSQPPRPSFRKAVCAS